MAVPPIGQSFYGSATLDGAPAPDGASVTAVMNGRTAGSGSVSGGQYSLVVNTQEGDETGDAIEFFINGYAAGNALLEDGEVASLPLSAVSPPVQYTLTINTNGSGTVSGAGTYNKDTVVNVSATPAAGWNFVNWTGDVANPNSAMTTVTMDANKTITANFSADSVEIGGTVTSSNKLLALLIPIVGFAMITLLGAGILLWRRRIQR